MRQNQNWNKKNHLDLIPSWAIYLVKTGGAVRKICVQLLTSATYDLRQDIKTSFEPPIEITSKKLKISIKETNAWKLLQMSTTLQCK